MLLKKGSRGDLVKKIQRFLNINDDGIFGNQTESAVIAWQLKNGLIGDGIVGQLTWNAMFRSDIDVESIVHGSDVQRQIKAEKRLPLNMHKLKKDIPKRIIDELLQVYSLRDSNLNSVIRLSHFLSQCAHESDMFTQTVENLNYSAERLLQIFPKYFNEESALEYARNPKAIANRVYARRMGNGNEESGDGWKYRGRGYIQLTGKNMYKLFNRYTSVDIIESPEVVATHYALASAIFYFDSNNIWQHCDRGTDRKTVIRVTKAVNGGLNGIDHRMDLFYKFYRLLSDS